MAGDLVAGVVQRLHGIRPLLHREPVDVDGGAYLVALEHLEDAPDAGIAPVVRVRERDQVHFEALRFLEMPAAGECLERDGERGANFLAVGPLDLRTHVTFLLLSLSSIY